MIVRSPAENRIAPPVEPVWLFQMPEPSIERFEFATKIAPPRVLAMLPSKMQPATTTLSPLAQIAPPSSCAWPFASVMPENVAVIALPPARCTLKRRVPRLPSTLIVLTPGPARWSVSVIAISLASEIMPVRPAWNWTVSAPAAALAWPIASRRLPAPVSLRFVTVNVAAPANGEAAAIAPAMAVRAILRVSFFMTVDSEVVEESPQRAGKAGSVRG